MFTLFCLPTPRNRGVEAYQILGKSWILENYVATQELKNCSPNLIFYMTTQHIMTTDVKIEAHAKSHFLLRLNVYFILFTNSS
jgi:hypothetical protein